MSFVSSAFGSLQVLYAEVGATNHPAKKIVGAQLLLSSQTVRVARGAFGQGIPTHAVVSASTSFVELPGRAYDYVPPTPTIVPQLPSDLFYPFLIDENDKAIEADDAGGVAARSRRLEEQPPSNVLRASSCGFALGAALVFVVWRRGE